ncbi:MAG: hypothetical protein ACFFDT_17085 [Candidatus Hodarchaeota archaeon]
MRNKLVGVFICVLIFSSVKSTSAVNGWSDTFPVDGAPDDWEFYAYHRGDTGGDSPATPLTEEKYHIRVRNGALMAPYYSLAAEGGLIILSEALRNSTLAYGTWSFDWIVSEESHTDHGAYDIIGLMANSENDIWIRDGLTESEWAADKTGYGLYLLSRSKSELGYDPTFPVAGPGITFYKGTDSPSWGKRKVFCENVYGTHHIDIQRTPEGEFKIYYDNVLIIEDSDNKVTTSEKFLFSSFQGDSGIDNLVVTNETTIIDPPETIPPELDCPPPFPIELILIAVTGIVIIAYVVWFFKKGRKD